MLSPGFALRRLDPVKPADVVIYKEGDRIVAVNRYGNNIADSDNLNDTFDIAKEKCKQLPRCKMSFHGEFEIKRPLVVDRSDIVLDGFSAKLTATASMDEMILIDGVTTNPYRVIVAGFILDANGLASNGIKGYNNVSRAPIDSIIYANTIMNAKNNGGIAGWFYNTLIMRNIANYNYIGIVISGGQHVTLLDNATYMNKGPGVVLSLTDTAYIIRHKSLTDGIDDTFWRCAIALNGLKTHVLQDFEIWTSKSSALYYAIRVWARNQDEYYYAIISNGMIRDEGTVNHVSYVRFEAYYDKHVTIIDNVDARQADSRYTYSVQIVNDAGKVIVKGLETSLSPSGYLKRLVVKPHRFLADCSDLPSAGVETGQSIVCYDSASAKWVLKVWDGSAWQTIG